MLVASSDHHPQHIQLLVGLVGLDLHLQPKTVSANGMRVLDAGANGECRRRHPPW